MTLIVLKECAFYVIVSRMRQTNKKLICVRQKRTMQHSKQRSKLLLHENVLGRGGLSSVSWRIGEGGRSGVWSDFRRIDICERPLRFPKNWNTKYRNSLLSKRGSTLENVVKSHKSFTAAFAGARLSGSYFYTFVSRWSILVVWYMLEREKVG